MTRAFATTAGMGFVRRVDPTASSVETFGTAWSRRLDRYASRVLFHGLAEANRRVAENRVWVVWCKGARGDCWANVTDDGRFRALAVDWPPPEQGEAPDEQAAVAAAVKHVRDFTGVDVTPIRPEVQRLKKWPEILVRWKRETGLDQAPELITANIGARGLRVLTRNPDPQWTNEREKQFKRDRPLLQLSARFSNWRDLSLFWFVPLSGVFMLTLFFLKKMGKKTQPTALVSGTAATIGALVVYGAADPRPGRWGMMAWIVNLAGAVTIFCVAYALLRVAENYLFLELPVSAVAWRQLVLSRIRARTAGLSLLRGAMCGVLYCIVHLMAMKVLGSNKIATSTMDWIPFIPDGELQYAAIAAYVVALSLCAAIALPWCLTGFPMAIAHRVSKKVVVLLGVPALLWTLFDLGLPGARVYPLSFLFLFCAVQGLFSAWLLYRYDLLTLVAAIFTIGAGLACYPVTRMVHPTEPLPGILAMTPWFLLVLTGVVIYLRPQIVDGWGRLKAVFQ